ncbi:MAG TPA: hypothetical protein VK178_07215 [Opitutaceae bacterium]|nr:hypothetical protein [Opitutaceae bacterium]
MKIRIPLAALAIDETNPQAGDPVEGTYSGKVDSIDGEMAVVTLETVNGVPAPAGAEMSAEPDEDDLRRHAEEADKLPFGNP